VVPVRLQKFLAEAGIASRRRSEDLIRQGKVTVNGQTVTLLGTKIEPGTDRVAVAGKPVRPDRKVYVALHKPPGVVCTNRDTHGRRCAVDLLPATLPRVYPVGRLDQDTTGLLLLTNDGSFSLRLTHPRYKRPKKYRVLVGGNWRAEMTARLLNGVVSDGERLRAASVALVRTDGVTTELELVLREGKNRQIRRMMTAVGRPVQRLVRVAVGDFELTDLEPGQWRYLKHEEVQRLLHD
jgi:23S rRNA pseudouridine2605 synthase